MRYRGLTTATVCLTVGLALGFQAQEIPDEPARGGSTGDPRVDDHSQGIFFAVLEGLYRDGVGNDVVDRLTAVDEASNMPRYFVYACPICMPAWNAMRVYRGRPGFYGSKIQANTFGPGLSEELRARILADDDNVVRGALQELVERWMERHLQSLRLTAEEARAWSLAMEKGRKLGMAYLQAYREQGVDTPYAAMETCPLCEGANGACERR